jgi:integrase
MGIKQNVKSVAAASVGRHQIEGVKGLYLAVGEGGSRRWLYRYARPGSGKPNETGLGSLDDVSLAEATGEAQRLRALVRNGIDPIAAKREQKRKDKVDGKTMFHALDAYAKEFASKPGVGEVRRLIERHCATLLPLAVANIDTIAVKNSLVAVQASHPKTAARTRAALSVVFNYCKANGLRTADDPASQATFKFLAPPPPKSIPHRMLPPHELPGFYRQLILRDSNVSLGLAFLILVAGRTSEILGLTWNEVDFDQRMIMIPGARMKARAEHRIPISDAAHAILTTMRGRGGDDGYVFKAPHGGRLSNRVFEGMLHRAFRLPVSAHGFRASFSSWAHAETDCPHELIELALAHLEGRGNQVARAYNRTDAVERRRGLMQQWGEFVTSADV